MRAVSAPTERAFTLDERDAPYNERKYYFPSIRRSAKIVRRKREVGRNQETHRNAMISALFARSCYTRNNTHVEHALIMNKREISNFVIWYKYVMIQNKYITIK